MNNLYFGTGASSCKNYNELYPVISTAIRNGIRRFDTAPSYGTEAVLGEIIERLTYEFKLSRKELWIQTKIDPWQMQEKDGDIREFVEKVMEKLHLQYLDALLIHWPVPEYFDKTWKAFEQIKEAGLVKQIGVCNIRIKHLKRMMDTMYPPQIVQIERNPLRTCEEEVFMCRQKGIEVQAYSPLCKMDTRIRDSKVIQEIANQRGKSVGQVVLRWHIDTGVYPVFTSKSLSRIQEYASLEDFSLATSEIAKISALNENYKMYLESCICPGF